MLAFLLCIGIAYEEGLGRLLHLLLPQFLHNWDIIFFIL